MFPYHCCRGGCNCWCLRPSEEKEGSTFELLQCPTNAAIDVTAEYQDSIKAIQTVQEGLDIIPLHFVDFQHRNPTVEDGDFDAAEISWKSISAFIST